MRTIQFFIAAVVLLNFSSFAKAEEFKCPLTININGGLIGAYKEWLDKSGNKHTDSFYADQRVMEEKGYNVVYSSPSQAIQVVLNATTDFGKLVAKQKVAAQIKVNGEVVVVETATNRGWMYGDGASDDKDSATIEALDELPSCKSLAKKLNKKEKKK